MNITDKNKEQALLVGQSRENLAELINLAKTAGVEAAKLMYFKSEKINPAFYIGSGKLAEIKQEVDLANLNPVIFNNELTPAQHRNLEEKLEVKVLDRSQVILDIFAIHAHTKESKLQVELAQLEYLLPRLTGHGTKLSRLGGGIGTRGPGETKLETDRRRIKTRISRLKKEIKEVKRNRQLQRKNRKDPLITLVGYTNAGKSTLINLLTAADTLVADQLFATLDSTIRQLLLPIGFQVIISDTIGFIDRFPPQLIASFAATLEEIKQADLLVHVVDSSHPDLDKQIKVVNQVLYQLNVLNKDIILLFNKIDNISAEQITELQINYPGSSIISAQTGQGREQLIEQISAMILKNMKVINLKIPYDKANLINTIHQTGEVYHEEYLNNHILIRGRIARIIADKLKKYQYNQQG